MTAKPKKIIVICHNYEPVHTPKKPDPENRFYTYGFGSGMGRNLKKYNPEYEIEVWRLDGYTDKYYEDVVDNVKFRVFPSFHRSNIFDFSFKMIRELKKEVKKTDPVLAILHTHYWVAYHLVYIFRKSKLITTHHGDWSPFFRIHHTKGLRKIKARIDMFAEKRVFKYIDYVFASELKQIPYIRMAYPDMKFFKWSTGVNFEHMRPVPKDEAKKEVGWDVNKKYILYIGKLYKFKQVDDLIRIWQDIKKTRPEIELVVIGNTPDDPWEEYYDMAKNSGAMLLGRILNVELYKYYSAADVYVLIALREDYFGGSGVAALESLACNTPVVSYAMRNYLGDKIDEIAELPDTLEKYKEAILKVIDNPHLYKNMRENVCKYYSYEAVYAGIKPAFEELFDLRKS
jgi:glycosyltransferase involved in cell wall biosynthesis